MRSRHAFFAALFAAIAVPAASSDGARIGPDVSELVEIAEIDALAPSPDGRKVAFRVSRPSIAANSYRVDWYVADLGSNEVRRVASGGAPIYNDGAIEAEPPSWSADSRSFYYRSLAGGAIGIRQAFASGAASRLIRVGPADVESVEMEPGRKALTYVTGATRRDVERAERREYDEGILIDATVDPAQNLYRGGFVHGRLASQRLVGRWFQRDGLLSHAPRTRHRLDLGTMREDAPQAVPAPAISPLSASWKPPAVTARSVAGAVATLSGSDDAQVLSVERPRATAVECSDARCRGGRLGWLAWRPGSAELVFSRTDPNLRQSLYAWDTLSNRVRLIVAGDGQLSGSRSSSDPCAVTSRSVVCVVAGPVSPPRLERFDLDRPGQAIVYDPNVPARARPQPEAEQLGWTLDDGRAATGIVLRRPGVARRRAPLFVNYYYCPGYLRGGVGDAFPLAPLVDAGFVVACLNVVPFREWGDGADRERAALASVKSLVALLDRRGWIDRSRVGMGGFSAGSEATMWVAMNSDLLRAAAVVSPQYEPTQYWMSAVRGRDFPAVLKDFQQVGPPDQDPERWKVISPALNVDRIKAPLLMQLPEQEMRSAMELYARLSNSRTPVEMYAFPDEAHVKLQPRHQLAIYRRNLDWFRYWLQGVSDPDPAAARQFRRWDALRDRQGSIAK